MEVVSNETYLGKITLLKEGRTGMCGLVAFQETEIYFRVSDWRRKNSNVIFRKDEELEFRVSSDENDVKKAVSSLLPESPYATVRAVIKPKDNEIVRFKQLVDKGGNMNCLDTDISVPEGHVLVFERKKGSSWEQIPKAS